MGQTTLRDALEQLETETFEIQDYAELGADFASHCGGCNSCQGCNGCACSTSTSCSTCSTTSTTSTVTCSCM